MKEKPLSTRQLRTYQTLAVMSFLSLGSLYLIVSFPDPEIFEILFRTGFVSYFGYIIIFKRVMKLQNVSYDDQSFYIQRIEYEIQIPFTDVKDIELLTISGTFKIKLKYPTEIGEEILFKGSLKYPFNYKKVDELMHQLRMRIRRAKRPDDIQGTALQSFNS